MLKIIVILASISMIAISHANIISIIDTTMGGATIDGVVTGGEYVGTGTGVNVGFGDVWGAGSTLDIDSDIDGNLQFGLITGGGSFNDIAVIYFDTVVGGHSGTTTLIDTSSLFSSAISGAVSGSSDTSDLIFASGFSADYAMTWGGTGDIKIYALPDFGSFILLSTLAASGNEVEFSLSTIGLGSGDNFDYFSTYLNPYNAFRSDEFHGVDYISIGNPGYDTVSLSTGSFNTFTSIAEPLTVPEPSTVAIFALGLMYLGLRYKVVF